MKKALILTILALAFVFQSVLAQELTDFQKAQLRKKEIRDQLNLTIEQQLLRNELENRYLDIMQPKFEEVSLQVGKIKALV